MLLSSYVATMLLATGSALAASSAPPPGLDPVLNMCSRWNHQSVIKNNMLYIDGGYETFCINSTAGTPHAPVILGENNYLITVDMSQSWDWGSNITEQYLAKNANSATGAYPPQVVRAGLYSGPSNDSNIYLYGGTSPMMNTSFPGFDPPPSTQYTLWSYDTHSDVWDQYDTSLATPERPNGGARTEAPDQGLAFFFNGQMDNGTSLYSPSAMQNMTQFLEGFVIIDLLSQTTRNVSSVSATGNTPQSRAQMVYIPEVGAKGILVVVGGSYMDAETQETHEIGTLVAMDEVLVLDVASLYNDGNGTWYKQKTSGPTPPGRVDHCAVAVSAPDNSSTQISIYGGRNSTAMIDDIWTLSVPAFQWTQVYTGTSPRWGHTCHVVGNRQMLTVGGSLQPPENLTMGCDWEAKSVAIWDMSIRQWGSVFDAAALPYTVPSLVFEDIGGGADGGATMLAPSAGWAPGLDDVFLARRQPATTEPSSSAYQLPEGAIVGIIGGVAGFILVTALVAMFWVWRRRKRSGPARKQAHAPNPVEVEGNEVQEKDSDAPQFWHVPDYESSVGSMDKDYYDRIRATNASPAELESPDSPTHRPQGDSNPQWI